jgi:acyl transferase domain-containing protein/NADPH:quinone reductase-like Zn-dependent oxidoreductase/thioesterase domain-containing protein
MSDLGNAIAIVGMSLRFPKASTPEEFWNNLLEGRDCAKLLDREELAKLGVAKSKLDSPEYVYRSYDLDNIDLFDAKFFGISPREARMADPQLRIMLEVTQECIEDSGHILQGTNTGMYFGVADHKYWLYHNLFQSPLEEQNEVAKRIFAIKDFFATQVSHKLGLNGPSISLSSACSTGLLATHEACNHLLMYDCDYAIAGGCEILQGAGYQYLEGGLSARDGYVRTFDKDASGTVFGSGVGMVMLRRLADALEDGDRIYAVIRSTAVNNDGNQKVGYMAPGVKGQMGVIREAIDRAGISARDISYVEAHGTGTKVGDPIEVEAISKVYRKYTGDNQYCAIGSVKTNVGHLSIAAGIAGLIKTSLMLYHKKIPPILHYKQSNPAIDFESSPFYVCRELQDWKPYNGKRIAGISAFGVGGTNAHAIVQEAPVLDTIRESDTSTKLFVLSAKSEKALQDSRARLAAFLRSHPDVELDDVAYTLALGRQQFEFRCFEIASSRAELIEALEKAPQCHAISQGADRQIVFMFPGQGSQYVNMGLQLYLNEPVFREHFDRCCAEAERSLGIDLKSVVYPPGDYPEPANALIHQTKYTQISLFAISYSLAQLWMHWGIKPHAMIGHSIGEYVAACLSGVFSLADTLALVAHRGRLMQSMPKGSMLSVPLAKDEIRKFLNGDVSVAGENSPASCVVSGPELAITKLKADLLQSNTKSTLLHTSHAFHSKMMDPILPEFESVVRAVKANDALIPFVSNVSGTWITAEQVHDPRYWVSQLREAVLFSKGLRTVAARDCAFVEIGPGATLCSLVGQHELEHDHRVLGTTPRAKDAVNAADFARSALAKAWCYGLDVNWNAVYGTSRGRRVPLPTYPFERKSYWIDEEILNKPRTVASEQAPLDHPLLGNKVVASAKVVVFENVIDKETPRFIADHRLVETVIFPGAGYTQMGLEVGKYFIKNKKIRVEEIRFAQAMMLPDGVSKVVQIIATASGEGCLFEILSRNQGKSEASDVGTWVLHAKGKIVPHSLSAEPIALPALINQPGAELVPLSRYYDALKFITFGPSFRAIKRLWIGENANGELESLGHVELPTHLYAEVDRYSFHPVLLDAAFQVIDGPKISQSGTLPVGLRNFTVYDAVPNTFYVHAVRRQHAEEEYSIGKITVFSESGRLIAKIDHYLQKEIADSIAAGDPLADVLFNIEWKKTDAPVAPRVKDQRTWVLLGETSPFDAELEMALRKENRKVIRASRPLHGTDSAYAVAGSNNKPTFAENFGIRDQLRQLITTSHVDTIVFTRSLTKESEARQAALELSLELVELAKLIAACESDAPPRIVIVTSGAQLVDAEIRSDDYDVQQASLWGIGNTLTVEHPEYRCLRIDVDETANSATAAVSDLVHQQLIDDQIVYRDGQRFTPRVVRYQHGERSQQRLSLPDGPFEVRLMRFGTFDTFAAREFVPDLLGDTDVLVEMRSTALNFKETLYVLGFLNPNNRQAANFDFGMEGAGRIKRVGARVSHLKPGDDVIVWHNGCLTSDFVVSATKVIRKPTLLSYAQAACIPTVFMTAYYALYHLAKIKPGDRVLIHAAAGGVGQVSIQIAKAVGAEIYATASRGKWAHLRQQGVDHIFDSRSLDFSKEILAATSGRGVDIVFNSLNGDFIEKSFDTLAQNGRFIEIGKKEIWSAEKAAAYRPDVNYQCFEIGEDKASGGIGEPSIIQELMVRILDDFETGKLLPLAMTEFPVSDIQQAYRYLSAGKNIGKVVVNFEQQRRDELDSNLVSPDKTYLVTGGLGGLGFLCANWLISHGAKHIALVGRRAPNEDVANAIKDLNKIGINIYVLAGDVGEYADVARMINTIQASGIALGGVLHCAGVLEDGLIEQQTPEKFAKVFKPKVMGSWHLHQLTQNLSLDFFVCFSSVSAIIDGGGQSNYAAANAFMDRLMSYRRSQQLAGVSINWGAWADVGMAAQLAERRAMDMSHFISKNEAFAALERVLVNRDVQAVVCKLTGRLSADTKARMLTDLAQELKDTGAEVGELERIFLQNPQNTAEQNMGLFLQAQVKKVLGSDAGENIEVDTEFVMLGVDSLSMTELKNAVQHGMGRPLKMATFFANPTVARLARHLSSEYAEQLEFGRRSATTTNDAMVISSQERSIDFVELEDSYGEAMIFCFPGLNGNIFDFSDFAAASKGKFRVLVGETNSDLASLETDIRKIAADAIPQMKRFQKTGPYVLLGYSYGGVVALEVAHQLRSSGDEVDMLMMVDSFPHFHYGRDHRFMSFMSALITDSILAPLQLDQNTYDRLAVGIMEASADDLAEVLQKVQKDTSGAARVNLDLLNAIVEAGKRRSVAFYEPPKSIDGVTIRYVKADAYPRSMALAKLDGFLEDSAMRDETYGWGNFIDSEMEVRRLHAQHNEILKASQVGAILSFIDSSLALECAVAEGSA